MPDSGVAELGSAGPLGVRMGVRWGLGRGRLGQWTVGALTSFIV